MERRLCEHNTGKSFYTSSRGPWELIGFETFTNIEDTKKREKTLKHNPRMMLLFKKRLIAAKEVVG